jgi:hypothetical protein
MAALSHHPTLVLAMPRRFTAMDSSAKVVAVVTAEGGGDDTEAAEVVLVDDGGGVEDEADVLAVVFVSTHVPTYRNNETILRTFYGT